METNRGRLTDNEPILKQFNGEKDRLSWSITPTKIIQENHERGVERAIPLEKIQFYREKPVSHSPSMLADFGGVIGLIFVLAGLFFGSTALLSSEYQFAILSFSGTAFGIAILVASRKVLKQKKALSTEEENMRFLNIQTEVGGVGIYLDKSEIPTVLNTINQAMDANTMEQK